ncbi:hypothetical protein GJ496_000795 [Pomphorhynchus laevis]|nr:hypothetical protein GJ496_000795 [Pomphorhynchus laevis]
MSLWRDRRLNDLLCEARILQRERALRSPRQNRNKSWVSTFCRLMSQGKTQLAMKVLADPLSEFRILSPNEMVEDKAVKKKLIEFHPSNRWNFLWRTCTLNDSHLECISNALCRNLIPAILGTEMDERLENIIQLPFRFGNLGIAFPH